MRAAIYARVSSDKQDVDLSISAQLKALREYAIRNGHELVRVMSINEPSDDTPTGKLFEAMIESLDEFYSANLGEEVTRGMRESASRGFYISAQPPFGYRKVKVSDGTKDRPKLDVEVNQ